MLRRFSRYITPHIGIIVVAAICASVIALCDMVYVHVLADTVDNLKALSAGSEEEVRFVFFSFRGYFDGLTFQVGDVGDAMWAIGTILALMLIAVMAKGFLSYAHLYLTSRVAYKVIINIRNDMYSKITMAPLSRFASEKAGDLISRVIDDVNVVQNAIGSLSTVLRSSITLTIFVTMMFIKDWQLTILAIAVLPFLGHLIRRFGERIKDTSKRVQMRMSDIASQLQQTIFGIKVIKSFTAEEVEIDKFREINRHKYRLMMKRVRMKALLPALVEFLTAIGVALVFGFGCYRVLTGKLSTGWFFGYIAMMGMVFKPVRDLGNFNATLQQAIASFERIAYVLEMQEEVQDEPDAVELEDIRGEIEFRDVFFKYDEDMVLCGINLKIAPGERVAFVGPSGAGKTTLMNLIPRFYDAVSGEILIDGMPIRKVKLSSLRRFIGLVPQEMILFNGTIYENIAFGRPDASEEEVFEAARRANAHDFILSLPQGYQTVVGDRGMRLSGGQQQRISIARAILKDPKILLLDEATSSLDTESEKLVQRSLEELMRGRTTLIIAHRLSTVVNADRIVVIKDGRIIETGRHDELIARNGFYRKLCQIQLQ
jgi:subfamily B ATP-binding cassette protein MsbA